MQTVLGRVNVLRTECFKVTATAIEAACEAIDANAEGLVDLLRALIERQQQGEDAVQALVSERLLTGGAAVEMLTYEPSDVPVVDEFASKQAADAGERRSVIGTFRAAGQGGRSLLLFAHPDAEPVDTAVNWTVPPFAGEVRAGRIHGWGVADDLAGTSAMIGAVEALAAAGIRLAGEVIVTSTPSKRHARGIAAVLHHGHRADAALYLHPAESGAGLHEIKALASGQLEFTLTVHGQRPATSEPGHTAFSHLGINPLDKARLLIAALETLAEARAARVKHPLLEAAVGRSTNIMISELRFGGGVLSQLPETLTLGGAVSFPPGETMEMVQAETAAAIAGAVAADEWLTAHPPELHWVSGVSASEVREDNGFYRVVAGAVEGVCGFTPHVNAMHTSSDIRNPLVQAGIPTLGLGPLCGDLTHAGGSNEWVDRDDYIRAVKVAAATIIGWCGVAA